MNLPASAGLSFSGSGRCLYVNDHIKEVFSLLAFSAKMASHKSEVYGHFDQHLGRDELDQMIMQQFVAAFEKNSQISTLVGELSKIGVQPSTPDVSQGPFPAFPDNIVCEKTGPIKLSIFHRQRAFYMLHTERAKRICDCEIINSDPISHRIELVKEIGAQLSQFSKSSGDA